MKLANPVAVRSVKPLFCLMIAISFAPSFLPQEAIAQSSPLKKARWVTANDHEALHFETSQLTGRFVARDEREEFNGSGHGFRWLVFGPTGRDLHPDEGPIASHRRHRGSMGLYRVYSKTETFGAMRDDVAQVKQHPDGATLTWPASDKRPATITATWRVTGPAQLDLTLQASPTRDIEKFEILLANYVPYNMTKGVYFDRGETFRSTTIRPTPIYGGEKDYPFFPLNAVARGNQAHTGRIHSPWLWGTIVAPQNAKVPLVFATDKKTQIVLMGDPESTSAVCVTPTPDSGEPEDWTNVEKHSAQYLSFFCRDVKAGERLTARARVNFVKVKDGFEATHHRLYRAFLSSK